MWFKAVMSRKTSWRRQPVSWKPRRFKRSWAGKDILFSSFAVILGAQLWLGQYSECTVDQNDGMVPYPCSHSHLVAGDWGSFNGAFQPWPRTSSVLWQWLCMIYYNLQTYGIKVVCHLVETMAQAFYVNLHNQRESREQTPSFIKLLI